jgi:hypothetical protein
MSVKISELTASSTVTSNDFVPIVDYETVTTKRASAEQILNYVTGSTFNSLTVTNLTASNLTASTIQTYDHRVDDVLDTNFLRISGSSIVTDVYQDTSTRMVLDTNAQHFQFFKLSTPVTAGFGNASTQLTKINGINLELGNSSSTVLVSGSLTGSTALFTTISSSNANISGNLVLGGQVDLSQYPDYAYIIYTSSYDKLIAFPGLYISGNLTGSGHASLQAVSGTTAQFTEVTATNINILENLNFVYNTRISSIPSSSGDYFGASTLELIPDTNLIVNGQYLVIDPTSPNHIHIRAGGLIDDADAQLIVGGEKANIIIRDQDNSYTEKHWVQITTTQNTTSASYVWDFGNDGKLTLPGELTGTIAQFTELTGNIAFSASEPSHWSGSPPSTLQEAINRIAAAVFSGSTGAIA